MNDRAEIEARFLKAAAALLHAGKKAAAAFKECDFISVSAVFQDKTTERSQK